jgi:anaerobic selenocysteine-containing dehydrogenase
MLTTLEDGVVTGVRGDPQHPFTRGALCPKVRNYEARVYHPDRVLHPLIRVGAKGAGEFRQGTWEEALQAIESRFNAVTQEFGAEAIAPCSYLGQQGLLNGLHCGDAFFNRLGASVGERTFCNAGATLAYNMTLGNTPGLDPESFVHAKLILIWGCNIIGSMPHHWPFIREAQKSGARLVVIDPTRSRTAAKADLHIRPHPGTDVALAFGIMRYILQAGNLDSYADRHIHGLEQLRENVSDFSSQHVEDITGVPAEQFLELAKAYANTPASAIRVGVALERSANGPDAVRAIATLPALTGAWQHIGGGIFQNAGRAFPMNRAGMARPDFIKPGTRVVNVVGLGRALTGDLDPPIKALMVYNCNPVIASADQALTIQGLEREDLFTVVSEQFMTDTARYADIVLPATTQLEQVDLMYSWGHFYLTLNTPALAPLGQAVSNTELFRRLARQFGFKEEAFRRTDEQLLEDALDWTHPSLDGVSLKGLRQTGWARLALGDPASRLPHEKGQFPTATGKCEFVATQAEEGTQVLTNFRQCYEGEQEGAPLNASPMYRPVPSRDDGKLTLVSPKTHYFLNSSYANFDSLLRRSGQQWLLVHPDDAAAVQVIDNDIVDVKNDHGCIQARVRVTDDTRKGVAIVPHGFWRTPNSNTPGSVNVLNPMAPTILGKAPTFSDTRVSIQKAAFEPR